MHVLVSAYSCGPGRGSEVGNGWNWSVALADEGLEVTILTQPSLRAEIDREIAWRTDDRLRAHYVPVPRFVDVVHGQIGVYARYLAWQFAAYRSARRLLKNEHIDVIHHLTWGSLQLGTWLGRLDPPLVFGPVGGGQTAPRSLRPYYVGRWSTEAVRTFVTRRLLPFDPFARAAVGRSAVVLVNNDETGTLVRRLGSDHVRYHSELGLHETGAPSRTARDDDLLRLLWVGRLMPRKGLPLALEAVRRVAQHVPVHLTILGGGPQEAYLAEQLSDPELAAVVTAAGHRPLEEVLELYRDNDVLLFTSLRDSTGAQLLEAMAVGLPVLTLDHSGASILVGDDRGVRVPVTDAEGTAEALARAIEEFAHQPELRYRLSEGALAYAETQRWSAKAREMRTIYEQATGTRRA